MRPPMWLIRLACCVLAFSTGFLGTRALSQSQTPDGYLSGSAASSGGSGAYGGNASANVSWIRQDPPNKPVQRTCEIGFDYTQQYGTCNTTGMGATFTTCTSNDLIADGGPTTTCGKCTCTGCNLSTTVYSGRNPTAAPDIYLQGAHREDLTLRNDPTTWINATLWVNMVSSADFISSFCTTTLFSRNTPSNTCGTPFSYIGFRCSATGADGGPDLTWKFCSSDGTAVDACVDTGVKAGCDDGQPDASVVATELGVDCSAVTSCDAWINGVKVVAAWSTHIPAPNTPMFHYDVISPQFDGGINLKWDPCLWIERNG